MRTTDTKWDALRYSHYLSTNTVDPDMDIDGAHEFFDCDNEHYGLTIVEFEHDLEQMRYLKGYNIL
jgi:hypothetical protein